MGEAGEGSLADAGRGPEAAAAAARATMPRPFLISTLRFDLFATADATGASTSFFTTAPSVGPCIKAAFCPEFEVDRWATSLPSPAKVGKSSSKKAAGR
eukprot:CAMPEP_0182469836 /NCGR_PEP_ID=MMETSP1319-20130603/17709_1 /TAXON_ID=172717 /ORGANISM="Bolidomonas pacifica, Strain RCC208" /LENGTH=98 /DNA_ID=CAMNT_0024670191 /DNA_START=445 /DNA_END=741 /DNA_ORIENTATION=-